MEISVKDLWRVLKRSVLFMIAGALVLSLAFYFYTSTQVQKVYQSSAKYFLSPQQDTVITSEKPATEEMNAILVVGSKYIDTLGSYLLTEETMTLLLEDVERYAQMDRVEAYKMSIDPDAYDLDGEYTANALLGLFEFIGPGEEETNLVFQVKCEAYSAHDSLVLLDVFGRLINERCKAKVLLNMYEVETIAEPKEGVLVAPNAKMSALLGGVLGAAVPYVFFLVLSVLDTRVKSEEDVKSKFKYPVLGQIPHL